MNEKKTIPVQTSLQSILSDTSLPIPIVTQSAISSFQDSYHTIPLEESKKESPSAVQNHQSLNTTESESSAMELESNTPRRSCFDNADLSLVITNVRSLAADSSTPLQLLDSASLTEAGSSSDYHLKPSRTHKEIKPSRTDKEMEHVVDTAHEQIKCNKEGNNGISFEYNQPDAKNQKSTFTNYVRRKLKNNIINRQSNLQTKYSAKLKSADTRVLCNKCKKSFQSNRGLKRHIFLKHKSKTQKRDPSERAQDLPKVQNIAADKMKKPTEIGKLTKEKVSNRHQCFYCKKTFIFGLNLVQHMKTHFSEERTSTYKCEQCQISFTDRLSHSRHTWLHSQKRSAWCNSMIKKNNKHTAITSKKFKKIKKTHSRSTKISKKTEELSITTPNSLKQRSNCEKGKNSLQPRYTLDLTNKILEQTRLAKANGLSLKVTMNCPIKTDMTKRRTTRGSWCSAGRWR